MSDVRQYREYSLDGLYMDLVYCDVLVRMTPANLRWAVTATLTLIDPAEVTRRIILPLLDESHAGHKGLLDMPAWQGRKAYYPYLVYLIGRIRSQDPIILKFLGDCVNKPEELPVMIGAMAALGMLYTDKYQVQFIEFALGKFPEELELAGEKEAIWLRRTAIEALGHIGDSGCVQLLQRERKHWPPELERALYLASQEIDWRFDYQPQR